MTPLIRAKVILLKKYRQYLPKELFEDFDSDVDDLLGWCEALEINDAEKNCGIQKIENEIKLPNDPPVL